MATHSSVLAWRVPGMAEPGGLPSMGSHRVGHDWSDLAAAAAAVKGYGFSSSHVRIWEVDHKESWAPKDWCFWTVVLEKTLESPLDCKEIQPVHPKWNQSWIVSHWKDWCWSWSSNTLATWCEELTHWKRSWCWERLKVEGEGDDRGWDGWMASPTRRTWVWVSSGRWWWTGEPGVLQSMGLQRIRHAWATKLNWWHGLSVAFPFRMSFFSLFHASRETNSISSC